MSISNVSGATSAAVQQYSTDPTTGASGARQALAEVSAKQAEKAAEVAAEKPSPQEIAEAAKTLSEYIQVSSRSLNINVDSELREPIVRVVDAQTDEVVRQIPSEEVVSLARYLRSQADLQQVSTDTITGLFVDAAT